MMHLSFNSVYYPLETPPWCFGLVAKEHDGCRYAGGVVRLHLTPRSCTAQQRRQQRKGYSAWLPAPWNWGRLEFIITGHTIVGNQTTDHTQSEMSALV